jgi:hypothetical protein
MFGSTAGALLLGATAYVAAARYMARAAWQEGLADPEAGAVIVPADTGR